MSRIRAFASFTALIERFIGLQKYSIALRASYNVAHLEGLFSESTASCHESLHSRAGVWGQGGDGTLSQTDPTVAMWGFVPRGPAKLFTFIVRKDAMPDVSGWIIGIIPWRCAKTWGCGT